jgi:hypothetical protein
VVDAQPATSSIKLFDAALTAGTGPGTSAAQALPYATRSIVLVKSAGDTAVLSSTPDGTGNIVIDNFITINGKNACEGAVGRLYFDSCFGPVLDTTLPVNVPVETVLTPIPPIDVSALIPTGTTSVIFELRDYGSIAGATDLYLVTTSKQQPAPVAASWDGAQLIVSSPAPDARNGMLNVTIEGDLVRGQVMLDNQPIAQVLQQLPGGPTPPPQPLVSVTYEPTFLGVAAGFAADRYVLTGQVAGRPIVPMSITPGGVPTEARFQDNLPAPDVTVTDEQMAAALALATRVETHLPSMTPVLAATCSQECIESACKATKDAGFAVEVKQTSSGPVCDGTGNAEAAEEYRQQFNQCYQSRCSLLGRLLSEGASFLPYQLSRIFEATADVTTKGRRR